MRSELLKEEMCVTSPWEEEEEEEE